VPALTAVVVDRALPDGARSMLALAAAGAAAVAAFQALTGWLRERMLLYLATRAELAFQRGVLEHLLRLPFPELERRPLGERLQAFTGLAAAREVLADRALGAVLDGAAASAFLVAMVAQLPVAAAAVAAVALAMAGLAAASGAAQARAQERHVEAQARAQAHLAELVAGAATVKAAAAEGRCLERWLRRRAAEVAHALRRDRLGLWSEIGLDALHHGVTVGLLVWGGAHVLRGELGVGALLAFAQLSAGFVSAVAGLASAHLVLATLRPELSRAAEVLAAAPERTAPRRRSRGASVAVDMENVWFRYRPDGPWVLKGHSLHVEPGANRVLAGASGSGKSTVLRLLAGLYEPEEGWITIGGASPRARRGDVLYLPQLAHLYTGSLLENLRILSGGAPRERILEAARLTKLAELAATLPMGYDAPLAPGGRNLSGGQRQLVAVTAAIASGRKLLLLDEALANIDPAGAAVLADLLEDLPSTLVEARHRRARADRGAP
jgi:ABC-type bacteriocin/lantibiotic exporter with double-glycine peptidase domain